MIVVSQQILAGAGQQILRTAGGQIIVVSTAAGVKTVQHVTTSQAGAGQGVKMIVVSSSGLAATTSKPVMMSAGVKTVSVRGGTNQILAGGGQTMMIGGKPVTVLTSGADPGWWRSDHDDRREASHCADQR